MLADAEPWRTTTDHGDAHQRVSIFDLGVGGIENCIGAERAAGHPGPADTPTSGSPVRMSLITPSGNIWCADVGAKLKCTIKEFDFPTDCHSDGMPLITMDIIDPPTADSCAGLALGAVHPQPAQYGDQIQVGSFFCSVEQTGLTCTNSEGHGFDLSRVALKLY